ncbi:heme utilization cystosolic carrier protein HutX [Consotaella aegiceratis]|uniref:heme utilization cystosolic carrier protein HutX n=1 Tax=Consotaella aegiceratis TaxID=3097961 RepID=UPI002F3FF259
MTLTSSEREAVRKAVAEHPGAALEDIARRQGCTTADVLTCLPEGEAVLVPGSLFARVWEAITGWGEITFIVNTGDVIVEVKADLPEGSEARGYFNLHGKPLGGHIRASECDRIAFVSRKLFASDTKSVQFYGKAGDCMFKIYLGRDENRQMRPEQIRAFEELCAELATLSA